MYLLISQLSILCKYELERGDAQGKMREDEQHYVWSLRFFLCFTRHLAQKPPDSGPAPAYTPLQVEFVSETVSLHSFHYLFNSISAYLEHLSVDKTQGIIVGLFWKSYTDFVNKDYLIYNKCALMRSITMTFSAKKWAALLEPIFSAYRELLYFVEAMRHAENAAVRCSAQSITSNLLYLPEFRDFLPTLFRHFNATKFTRNFLHELVDTTYRYVRVMEKSCALNQGRFFIQKKIRHRRLKRKPKTQKENTQGKPESSLVLFRVFFGDFSIFCSDFPVNSSLCNWKVLVCFL